MTRLVVVALLLIAPLAFASASVDETVYGSWTTRYVNLWSPVVYGDYSVEEQAVAVLGPDMWPEPRAWDLTTDTVAVECFGVAIPGDYDRSTGVMTWRALDGVAHAVDGVCFHGWSFSGEHVLSFESAALAGYDGSASMLDLRPVEGDGIMSYS